MLKATLRSSVAWVTHTYPARLLSAYGASRAANHASGLAFNAFVSMFPLILGMLSILGFATQSATARASVLSAALGFFPADAQSGITGALDGIREHPGLLGIAGIAGLLWSGSSLFTSMEFALVQVLGSRQRGFLRQRGMALVMTAIFVAAVVGTIAVNSLMNLVGGFAVLDPLAGVAVWFAFMITLYRLVPNRTFRLGLLWRGALLAGVLMELLTLFWALYTRLSHGFSTYGVAFALFFLLASWLYFLAQLILLGAVANLLHAGVPASVPGLLGTPDPASRGARDASAGVA